MGFVTNLIFSEIPTTKDEKRFTIHTKFKRMPEHIIGPLALDASLRLSGEKRSTALVKKLLDPVEREFAAGRKCVFRSKCRAPLRT